MSEKCLEANKVQKKESNISEQSKNIQEEGDKDKLEIEKPLEEQIEEGINKLPPQEKILAIGINYYLQQKKKLDEELAQKIIQLKFEYEQKSKPIYEKSQEIIAGQYPNEIDAKDIETFIKDEEKAELENVKDKQEEMAEYWYKAMWSNGIVSQEIKDQDIPILKKLRRIEYKPLEAQKYQLVFHFYPNDYFVNDCLTKTFYFDKEEEPEKSEGTQIQWKEGKNTTVKKITKTQKNKKTGAKRLVEKEQKCESFFNFFNDSSPLNESSFEEGENEEKNDVDRLNIDFDIFKQFIDEVIPYSLEYFLGVKSGEEEIDLDDEDDFIDDEEEEQEKNKRKQKNNKQTNDKQECKQQ